MNGDPIFTIQIKKNSKHGGESHIRSFPDFPSGRNQTRAKMHRAVDEFCDMMRVHPGEESTLVEQDSGSDRRTLVRE